MPPLPGDSPMAVPLKILCIIDGLGPGGAQRQLVTLACGLHARGHQIELFLYHPDETFFRPQIDACGLAVHTSDRTAIHQVGILRSLSRLTRRGGFDIVLSYLDRPNVYAELASVLVRGGRLVVSERSSYLREGSGASPVVRRWLHRLADHVVANSETQAKWLRRKRWLADKVSCIYNGLDLAAFETASLVPAQATDVRLLAIGRIGVEKNLVNLIKALGLLHDGDQVVPEIGWVGRQHPHPAGLAYRAEVDALLRARPEIAARWHWLGERSDVPHLLGAYHALIHPSLFEGLPNVVCEAMAAGKPVLVSDVCDHPALVADGQRGFLFDPTDPARIAAAITRLTASSPDEWRTLSRNARVFAEERLGIERMVDAYEALFADLVA